MLMTSTEPKVEPTGRYSITETCVALGIHRNTLRRYTDNHAIPCHLRKTTGAKFYFGKDIQKFWRASL